MSRIYGSSRVVTISLWVSFYISMGVYMAAAVSR